MRPRLSPRPRRRWAGKAGWAPSRRRLAVPLRPQVLVPDSRPPRSRNRTGSLECPGSATFRQRVPDSRPPRSRSRTRSPGCPGSAMRPRLSPRPRRRWAGKAGWAPSRRRLAVPLRPQVLVPDSRPPRSRSRTRSPGCPGGGTCRRQEVRCLKEAPPRRPRRPAQGVPAGEGVSLASDSTRANLLAQEEARDPPWVARFPRTQRCRKRTLFCTRWGRGAARSLNCW